MNVNYDAMSNSKDLFIYVAHTVKLFTFILIHVVQLYDIFETPAYIFLVFEL